MQVKIMNYKIIYTHYLKKITVIVFCTTLTLFCPIFCEFEDIFMFCLYMSAYA